MNNQNTTTKDKLDYGITKPDQQNGDEEMETITEEDLEADSEADHEADTEDAATTLGPLANG